MKTRYSSKNWLSVDITSPMLSRKTRNTSSASRTGTEYKTITDWKNYYDTIKYSQNQIDRKILDYSSKIKINISNVRKRKSEMLTRVHSKTMRDLLYSNQQFSAILLTDIKKTPEISIAATRHIPVLSGLDPSTSKFIHQKTQSSEITKGTSHRINPTMSSIAIHDISDLKLFPIQQYSVRSQTSDNNNEQMMTRRSLQNFKTDYETVSNFTKKIKNLRFVKYISTVCKEHYLSETESHEYQIAELNGQIKKMLEATKMLANYVSKLKKYVGILEKKVVEGRETCERLISNKQSIENEILKIASKKIKIQLNLASFLKMKFFLQCVKNKTLNVNDFSLADIAEFEKDMKFKNEIMELDLTEKPEIEFRVRRPVKKHSATARISQIFHSSLKSFRQHYPAVENSDHEYHQQQYLILNKHVFDVNENFMKQLDRFSQDNIALMNRYYTISQEVMRLRTEKNAKDITESESELCDAMWKLQQKKNLLETLRKNNRQLSEEKKLLENEKDNSNQNDIDLYKIQNKLQENLKSVHNENSEIFSGNSYTVLIASQKKLNWTNNGEIATYIVSLLQEYERIVEKCIERSLYFQFHENPIIRKRHVDEKQIIEKKKKKKKSLLLKSQQITKRQEMIRQIEKKSHKLIILPKRKILEKLSQMVVKHSQAQVKETNPNKEFEDYISYE